MSPRPDLAPKPRLGYSASRSERAAERRSDAAAMKALETDPRARTYVVAGELIILRKGGETHDPLFPCAEAHALGRTIESAFLGLMDDVPRFAVTLDQAGVEALKTDGAFVVTDLRSIAVR